ncbi:MAG: hypothetical protein WB646_01645 [Steroidobacteraceae bacterium]
MLDAGEGYCALSVDGTIAHTQASEPCEYCVVLDVKDDRGQQLTRQVVGVGVLQVGELRRLNVSVEMLPVRAPVAVKPQTPKAPAPTAAPVAVGPAKPLPSNPTGPQQPAKPIISPANAASMRGLGVIRKR